MCLLVSDLSFSRFGNSLVNETRPQTERDRSPNTNILGVSMTSMVKRPHEQVTFMKLKPEQQISVMFNISLNLKTPPIYLLTMQLRYLKGRFINKLMDWDYLSLQSELIWWIMINEP